MPHIRRRSVRCVNLSGKSKTYFNRTRLCHCKHFVFYTVHPPPVPSRWEGGWGVIKKVSPRRRRTRKENVQYSRPPEWIKWRESFETDDAKELETSSARKSQNVRPFRSARETENTRLNYAHDNWSSRFIIGPKIWTDQTDTSAETFSVRFFIG